MLFYCEYVYFSHLSHCMVMQAVTDIYTNLVNSSIKQHNERQINYCMSLLFQTRDICGGKGEYSLFYNMLTAWDGGVDVRKEELEKYTNKTILDFGCGTGFSTSNNKGSLGIDTSREMIDEAKKLFPDKRFSGGHAEQFKTDEQFDIVTCMFLMHEVPSFCRKNIIENALSIANEQVVILDIAPVYKPSNIMLEGEPYLPDYLSNISTELSNQGFTPLNI